MTLLEILSSETTIVGLEGNSKEEVIEELVDCLDASNTISDRDKVAAGGKSSAKK